MTDSHSHPYQRVFDEIATRQPVRAILDHVRNKYGQGHDFDRRLLPRIDRPAGFAAGHYP